MSRPEVSGQIKLNLVRLREQRGLTQVELGKRADIAAASISHFETGQRVPTLESLVRIADALEVSVDALVGRASAGQEARLDPVLLRASQADTQTLDAIRRVTQALLDQVETSRRDRDH